MTGNTSGTGRLAGRGTGPLDPARLLESLTALPDPAPAAYIEGQAPQGTDRLLEGPRPSPVAQLNAELRADAGRIFANWVVRATNLPHFRARPDLPLATVKGGMPEYVVAILEALSTADPALHPESQAAVAQAAVALARRRASQGFLLREVLAEVQELPIEILAAVWRAVDADPSLGNAPRAIIEWLVRLEADAAIAVVEDWTGGSGEGMP